MHFKAISGPYQGVEYDVTDDGAGNLYATGSIFGGGTFWGALDYALSGFLRNTTFVGTTPDDYQVTASYKSYQHNVTSFGRVTTTGSGTFSANFTVPAVANGNYNVTAIDSGGSMATATLNTIPEGFTIGVMMLLSSVAVIVGTRYFRKRPKGQDW